MTLSSLAPWLTLVGLGAFHGVNPAMGWLFAVALGLHRQRRSVVLASLLPIALGHAFAVALVALAVAGELTGVTHFATYPRFEVAEGPGLFAIAVAIVACALAPFIDRRGIGR